MVLWQSPQKPKNFVIFQKEEAYFNAIRSFLELFERTKLQSIKSYMKELNFRAPLDPYLQVKSRTLVFWVKFSR